jgi:hypothetical protein
MPRSACGQCWRRARRGDPSLGEDRQLTGRQDFSYTEIASYMTRHVGAGPALLRPVAGASAGMPEGSTPRSTTLDNGARQQCLAIAAPEPWPTIEAVLAAEAVLSIG